MPRREGLRPIGDSVKKIVERIRKEREERRNKNKPIRTQPKLPGMKKGGEIKGYMSGGFGIFSKKKAKADEPKDKESQAEKKKRRLEELKKELGMKDGGISRREGGRRKPKTGLPSLPGKPRPQPGPGAPPRKKKDSKDPNFGVEFNTDGPARPGKDITGYMVKKGGLIGGQKKLDVNKDGKISGDDFKILRGKQNKMKGGGIAIRGTNFKGVY
tara:strand:+ start:609 stop:1250 length:642 start_codon:yes stop_codon:yes gene_type:complete